MSERTAPTDAEPPTARALAPARSEPTHSWGKKIAIAAASLALVGGSIAVGVVASSNADVESTTASQPEERAIAHAEEAYALSLPVLGAWLDDRFAQSWIVSATTLEHAARALEEAAQTDAEYAVWAPRFGDVVSVADAVAAGDKDAAKTAFAPLLEAEPGPYADAMIDGAIAAEPHDDARSSLAALDAALAEDDIVAARVAAARIATGISEIVAMSHVHREGDDAPEVLTRALPVLHTLSALNIAAADGDVVDVVPHATALRAAYDKFVAWHEPVTP